MASIAAAARRLYEYDSSVRALVNGPAKVWRSSRQGFAACVAELTTPDTWVAHQHEVLRGVTHRFGDRLAQGMILETLSVLLEEAGRPPLKEGSLTHGLLSELSDVLGETFGGEHLAEVLDTPLLHPIAQRLARTPIDWTARKVFDVAVPAIATAGIGAAFSTACAGASSGMCFAVEAAPSVFGTVKGAGYASGVAGTAVAVGASYVRGSSTKVRAMKLLETLKERHGDTLSAELNRAIDTLQACFASDEPISLPQLEQLVTIIGAFIATKAPAISGRYSAVISRVIQRSARDEMRIARDEVRKTAHSLQQGASSAFRNAVGARAADAVSDAAVASARGVAFAADRLGTAGAPVVHAVGEVASASARGVAYAAGRLGTAGAPVVHAVGEAASASARGVASAASHLGTAVRAYLPSSAAGGPPLPSLRDASTSVALTLFVGELQHLIQGDGDSTSPIFDILEAFVERDDVLEGTLDAFRQATITSITESPLYQRVSKTTKKLETILIQLETANRLAQLCFGVELPFVETAKERIEELNSLLERFPTAPIDEVIDEFNELCAHLQEDADRISTLLRTFSTSLARMLRDSGIDGLDDEVLNRFRELSQILTELGTIGTFLTTEMPADPTSGGRAPAPAPARRRAAAALLAGADLDEEVADDPLAPITAQLRETINQHASRSEALKEEAEALTAEAHALVVTHTDLRQAERESIHARYRVLRTTLSTLVAASDSQLRQAAHIFGARTPQHIQVQRTCREAKRTLEAALEPTKVRLEMLEAEATRLAQEEADAKQVVNEYRALVARYQEAPTHAAEICTAIGRALEAQRDVSPDQLATAEAMLVLPVMLETASCATALQRLRDTVGEASTHTHAFTELRADIDALRRRDHAALRGEIDALRARVEEANSKKGVMGTLRGAGAFVGGALGSLWASPSHAAAAAGEPARAREGGEDTSLLSSFLSLFSGARAAGAVAAKPTAAREETLETLLLRTYRQRHEIAPQLRFTHTVRHAGSASSGPGSQFLRLIEAIHADGSFAKTDPRVRSLLTFIKRVKAKAE